MKNKKRAQSLYEIYISFKRSVSEAQADDLFRRLSADDQRLVIEYETTYVKQDKVGTQLGHLGGG